MKYSFVIVVVLFYFSSPALSQTGSFPKNSKPEKMQSQKSDSFFCGPIEKDPEVDTNHWQTYLARNLKLDSLETDTIPAGIYNIVVLFVIDKEGCITIVNIPNDPGYGLGDKVIRVMSSYTERWIPAERNGRKVKAFRKQVVTFIIEKKECPENLPVEFML